MPDEMDCSEATPAVKTTASMALTPYQRGQLAHLRSILLLQARASTTDSPTTAPAASSLSGSNSPPNETQQRRGEVSPKMLPLQPELEFQMARSALDKHIQRMKRDESIARRALKADAKAASKKASEGSARKLAAKESAAIRSTKSANKNTTKTFTKTATKSVTKTAAKTANKTATKSVVKRASKSAPKGAPNVTTKAGGKKKKRVADEVS